MRNVQCLLCLLLVVASTMLCHAGERLSGSFYLADGGSVWQLSLHRDLTYELSSPRGLTISGRYKATERDLGLWPVPVLEGPRRHFRYYIAGETLTLESSEHDQATGVLPLDRMPPLKRSTSTFYTRPDGKPSPIIIRPPTPSPNPYPNPNPNRDPYQPYNDDWWKRSNNNSMQPPDNRSSRPPYNDPIGMPNPNGNSGMPPRPNPGMPPYNNPIGMPNPNGNSGMPPRPNPGMPPYNDPIGMPNPNNNSGMPPNPGPGPIGMPNPFSNPIGMPNPVDARRRIRELRTEGDNLKRRANEALRAGDTVTYKFNARQAAEKYTEADRLERQIQSSPNRN